MKLFPRYHPHRTNNEASLKVVDPSNKHIHGSPTKVPTPTIDIFTDASCHGYGAIMGDKTMLGVWTRRYKEKHINALELEAIRQALLKFAFRAEPNSTGTYGQLHVNSLQWQA